jgi:uncharacterized protein
MPSEVTDSPAASRFELLSDAGAVFVQYHREGDIIVLTHTEVPQALSGRGIGSKLVRGTLDRLREENVKIVPRCEFVAAFIERHPEYMDLVTEGR